MKNTNKKMIYLDVICRVCDVKHLVIVTDVDVNKWQAGTFIQDAFPYLTAAERELLMRETCGPCFDKIYPQMEE
mgnify:CR=1 FL=1|jgi:hypothetical protein|tara:strand:- start:2559 stop:2780 length:222 start_codon:yes stop_codon:yes gene_type:complete